MLNIPLIKNCFKISLRNLLRNKGYSLINLSGLTVGIVCSFLIVMYIQHELSYDDFHENRSNSVITEDKIVLYSNIAEDKIVFPNFL